MFFERANMKRNKQLGVTAAMNIQADNTPFNPGDKIVLTGDVRREGEIIPKGTKGNVEQLPDYANYATVSIEGVPNTWFDIPFARMEKASSKKQRGGTWNIPAVSQMDQAESQLSVFQDKYFNIIGDDAFWNGIDTAKARLRELRTLAENENTPAE